MPGGEVYGYNGLSSADYNTSNYMFTPKKNNKAAFFGDSGDSARLQRILEQNGGNVPILGAASFRH